MKASDFLQHPDLSVFTHLTDPDIYRTCSKKTTLYNTDFFLNDTLYWVWIREKNESSLKYSFRFVTISNRDFLVFDHQYKYECTYNGFAQCTLKGND